MVTVVSPPRRFRIFLRSSCFSSGDRNPKFLGVSDMRRRKCSVSYLADLSARRGKLKLKFRSGHSVNKTRYLRFYFMRQRLLPGGGDFSCQKGRIDRVFIGVTRQ